MTCAMCYANHTRTCYALKMQIGSTYMQKMRSDMCYLQKIRCHAICKITISCYVLCKIKWPLLYVLCAENWPLLCAMSNPLRGPTYEADVEQHIHMSNRRHIMGSSTIQSGYRGDKLHSLLFMLNGCSVSSMPDIRM